MSGIRRPTAIRGAASLVILLLAGASQAQTITSLLDGTLPRAGRLIIHGTDFGHNQQAGRVTIGDAEAPISEWSDLKITAYVPEDALLSTNDVQVHTAAGASNTVPLNVTARPPAEDRIRWRFTADDSYVMSRPAVGPDGTVYVTGVFGHLYALTTDGGVRWVRSDVAGDRSPSVATDGRIYVTGGGGSVSALAPDGNVLWSWSGIGTVFVGPNVGPDGNIYGCTAMASGNETGAFVLSPSGQLLFSHAGGYNFRGSPMPWEVAFSGNQWFVTSGMGFPLEGAFGVFAFDLGGGGPNWNVTGIGQAFGTPGGGVCVNDPAGNRIVCYDQSGAVDWSVSLGVLGGPPAPPGVGSDGSYYVPIQSPGRFHAVSASGTIRWTRLFEWIRFPTARPDDALVVAYENPLVLLPIDLNAYDPADGTVLWSQPLDVIAGRYFTPQWYGAFSPDQRTFYIGSSGVSFGEEFCYVYAIDVDPTGTVVAVEESPSRGIHDLTRVESWPSPFDIGCTIRYSVARRSKVTLAVYDVSGSRTRALAGGLERAAGEHELRWDGRDDRGQPVPSGVYFVRLEAGDEVRVTKAVVAR